jgi:hypothetical protein
MIWESIITLWPGLLLSALFGFFKAVANSMEHHPDVWPHTPFWNVFHPENDKVKRIFSYPVDGYHIAGSGMWVCLGLSQVAQSSLEWYWHLPITMGFGVLAFNIFYNKVFE